jgi:plasmid stability protein
MSTTYIFLGIAPVDLVTHFKTYCAKRNVTMQDELIKLITAKLKTEPGPSKHTRLPAYRNRSLYIRSVPIDLKYKLKIWSAQSNRSMSDVVLDILEEVIARA